MTTEQKAAEALLDKGIKVPVTAPLFFRAFGKKDFYPVIRPSYLGTLYHIDLIYERAGLTAEALESIEDNQHGMYRKYVKPLSRAIAWGILNNTTLGMLLARPLAWYLRGHMTNIRLLYAGRMLDTLSRPQAFTTTTKLLGRLKMTAPNLGQEHGS